ncbi:MAG: hypothetical protein ABDH66_00885 [Bacteroidia bacterium]
MSLHLSSKSNTIFILSQCSPRSYFTGQVGSILVLLWGGGLIYPQVSYRESAYRSAQYYTQRRQWDSALIYWRGLLFQEKDSIGQALIYQQLGYIALYRGDSAEALRLWRQSLLWRPDYPVAIRNYQWLYAKLRRPPEATPPSLSKYEPSFPSEQGTPHLGSTPPSRNRKIRWLPIERLRN